LWFFDSLEKTLLLLLFGDVQKELENCHAIARQVSLEAADVLKAFLPDVFCDERRRQPLVRQNFRMHPRHEGFLVIAAIENADATALWQTLQATPEIIVVEFFAGRRLERKNLTALRVNAGHDMLDHTVFSGGVHSLKHKQYRPTFLCIKPVLKLCHESDTHG